MGLPTRSSPCVDACVGRDWAKGLTAATDPRVARMAAARRGMVYQQRTPIEQRRYRFASRTTLPLDWSNEMAYIVGLTATDGCLVTGRRAINFKSGDRELVETYLRLLGRTNRVKSHPTKKGGIAYYTQFHDSALYRWFLSTGLTPRKSLTIGALSVPEAFLLPLVRGLLDGDGSIINKVYRADTGGRSDYYWEYLITKFVSGSQSHLSWLKDRLGAVGIHGTLSQGGVSSAGNPWFELEYGKRASQVLLTLLYRDPAAPCLLRKRRIWHSYVERHDLKLS